MQHLQTGKEANSSKYQKPCIQVIRVQRHIVGQDYAVWMSYRKYDIMHKKH